MATPSLAQPARKAVDEEARREVLRTILRESLQRYRNELLDPDERELLWDRVVKLRRRLGIDA